MVDRVASRLVMWIGFVCGLCVGSSITAVIMSIVDAYSP